jgi:hypothetical protein
VGFASSPNTNAFQTLGPWVLVRHIEEAEDVPKYLARNARKMTKIMINCRARGNSNVT